MSANKKSNSKSGLEPEAIFIELGLGLLHIQARLG